MFDGLLKSKFYMKSKSAIKLTKTRIETIKRKRNAMEKYLKKDIADLLKDGLDVNAYGRVEGLWNELNLSCCYEFVQQFCIHISSNLTAMEKQRECPDECREAAASLMFAAARFADLPELRDLRNAFFERYGDRIDHYANKGFINKFKSPPPTKDMKLQLMQEIALQSGLEWNLKNLEQKLFNPAAFGKESDQSRNAGERKMPENIDAVQNMDDEVAEVKHEHPNKYTPPAREMGRVTSGRGDELFDDGSGLPTRRKTSDGQTQRRLSYTRREDTMLAKENQGNETDVKEQQQEPLNLRRASGEEEEAPFYYKAIRPSYDKSKISNRSKNVAVHSDKADFERAAEHRSTNGTGIKEDELRECDPNVVAKPIPKSVRRRNQKPQPVQDNIDGFEPEDLHSRGMNGDLRKLSRQCQKVSTNENHGPPDGEEKTTDRLLMHYSSKKKVHDTSKSESVLEPFPHQAATNRGGRGKEDNVRDGPPTRTASLPADRNHVEATKEHARACSFRAEMVSPKAHVHSKLPDYDDFVARLAALRANQK